MYPLCEIILTSSAIYFHCSVFFKFWLMHWLLCDWMDICIMAEGVWQSGEGDPSYNPYLCFCGCQPVSNCCHARPTWDWMLKSLTAMEINWRHLFTCSVAIGVPKLAVCQADLSFQTWIRQESGTHRFLSTIPLRCHRVSAESVQSTANRKSWKCRRILIKVIVSPVPRPNKAVIFL